MPENYYCPDNFFKKMTDLESPRKNNDCYFYYYSTCAKGDNCTFRHEPSALGCETMCSFWKEGKCLNVHCNFRHMELRKNRKAIPCYWESQPGGCLKPHCPFMHQSPKPATSESLESKTDSGTESAENSMTEKLNHSFKNPSMDSLVVNFEEESDNESATTTSPVKPSRSVKVKTLEEIKLEKIQAESAAYYSYTETNENVPNADDLRQRIWDRLSSKLPATRKRSPSDPLEPNVLFKKQRKNSTDVTEIKIKTLEEIRADRLRKQAESSQALCDSLVTSSTEDEGVKKTKLTKIKLQRKPLYLAKMETEDDNNGRKDFDVEKITTNNKIVDEVLLLQDDDNASNVSLKDEERLLNEMEDFLDD